MSGTRSRLALGIAAVALVASACSSPTPSASDPASPPASAASPSAVATPTAPAAEPGRPYDADQVLAAMRDSRRPGGVAEELQTQQIASRVADQLWTWDGAPWNTLAIGGTCAPDVCSLEVSGASEGSAGADLYTFSVDPAGGDVQLTLSDLHAYPASLDERLDGVGRSGVPAASLEGMALIGARWLPPPETGRYWLSYRSGGEEGSPGLDVLVDLPAGSVVETRQPG